MIVSLRSGYKNHDGYIVMLCFCKKWSSTKCVHAYLKYYLWTFRALDCCEDELCDAQLDMPILNVKTKVTYQITKVIFL